MAVAIREAVVVLKGVENEVGVIVVVREDGRASVHEILILTWSVNENGSESETRVDKRNLVWEDHSRILAATSRILCEEGNNHGVNDVLSPILSHLDKEEHICRWVDEGRHWTRVVWQEDGVSLFAAGVERKASETLLNEHCYVDCRVSMQTQQQF